MLARHCSHLLIRTQSSSVIIKKVKISLNCLQKNHREMSSALPPFLQVLAASVKVVDKAGDAIRDILKSDKLDIVEKTGADDLQTKVEINL